jgi:hypothetical protein
MKVIFGVQEVFEVVNNSIEALPANPTGQLGGKGQDKN